MDDILDTPLPDAPVPESKPQARGGNARKQKLSPEKRISIAKKAANARWGGNGKRIKASAASLAREKGRSSGRPQSGIFGRALAAAEERLAQAIQERARAASTWAVLNAEIPSLQGTIAALRNQQNPGTQPSYAQTLPDGSLPGTVTGVTAGMGYTLAQVVSDAPVPASATPRGLAASRVQGGAIGGTDLRENDENEDVFLTETVTGGGQWH